MLFDLSAEAASAAVGSENVVKPSPDAFPADVRESESARILVEIGVPRDSIFSLVPVRESGEFPRVRDVLDLDSYQAPESAGDWPTFGWLVNSYVALDPESGAIYAFSDVDDEMLGLHTDMSSLLFLLYEIAMTKEDVHPGNSDDAELDAYEERRCEGLDRVQALVEERDPVPFGDDNSVWDAALGDIGAGILRG